MNSIVTDTYVYRIISFIQTHLLIDVNDYEVWVVKAT
jgi:hypothetical protein